MQNYDVSQQKQKHRHNDKTKNTSPGSAANYENNKEREINIYLRWFRFI